MIIVNFKSLKNCLTSTEKLFCQVLRFYSVKFREKFETKYAPVNMTSWFPGHMYKGMLQLQAKLAVVDCIVEVHDARIPFSGRNPNFYTMLSAIRPHILVLNKSDLADLSHKEKIKKCLQKENINHVIYTNCTENRKGIEQIMPLAVNLIKDSDLYNRGNRPGFMIMVIGIPNVGKSSVINRLRNLYMKKKNASAVGAIPGITKSVLEKIKVSTTPDVYLLDSPGIMQPSINNLEVGLKLALCRTINDTVVGRELMADYLLYFLNKHKNFSYVEYLNLDEPIDDARLLLFEIAKKQNIVRAVKTSEGAFVNHPDMDACAAYFLKAFRERKFGKILLDTDILKNMES